MTTPSIVCPDCGLERLHYARGLCAKCYCRAKKARRLDDYPSLRDTSMDVDHVQVDRVVDWLVAYSNTAPAARPDLRRSRPALTRGERLEVLRRTRHTVPPWVAVEALGINGRYATRYLEQAAS